MKKIGLLFATVVMMTLFAFSASAAYENGLYFELSSNGEGYYVSDCNELVSDSITIPTRYNGKPVIGIRYEAFKNCNKIIRITIPDSITTIGSEAFQGCVNLISITIPDSVTAIGNYAFAGCDNLIEITIPGSAIYIGKFAFCGCDSLTNVTILNGVTSIGDSAFQYCYNLENIIIPDSVTSIGSSVFDCCTSLKNITIPNSVTSIGNWAFYRCESFTDIVIPDSVTTIGSAAFEYCVNITEITIPYSVTSIGDKAFLGCEKLTRINVDPNNRYYSNDSSGALFNKDKSVFVKLPEGQTITSYMIPDTVTAIGNYAFNDCDNLTSITIPNSVIVIGYFAFDCCESLTSIIIPDGVTSIGEYTFRGCYNLASITVPDSITSIGRSIFDDTEYYKDDSNWDNGVLYVGNHLIEAKPTITSCDIRQGTKTIADSAFFNCPELKSITIPDSLTSICSYAFLNITGLTDVYYSGTKSQWKGISVGDRNECLATATIHFAPCNHRNTQTYPQQNATCTENGNTLGTYCYDCEEWLVVKEEIPAKGHSHKASVTAPTCIDDGYTTYTCECGDTYVDDYIDATDHSYTSQITTPATHLTGGIKTYTCTACGDTYTEEIAKISEHTYTVSSIVAPTCEKEGYTVYKCECGDTYRSDVSSAVGHNYTGETCSVCGENKTENCTCNCHKSGFSGIIWKILRFFYKLFKINPTCACGVAHY